MATVTKRTRRVFAFSPEEFAKSNHLARPDIVMFTFLDYIGCNNLKNLSDFREWLRYHEIEEVRRMKVFVSNKTGKFVEYPRN